MNTLSVTEKQIEGMITRGVSDVFTTMLNLTFELTGVQDPNKEGGKHSAFQNCDDVLVVGNVGFVGEVSGMVYLAMSEKFSKFISSTMLGLEELEVDHEMVNDVIGELANMSAGAFKNQLADAGYACRLTIPSIIRGKYFVIEAADTTYRRIFKFGYGKDFVVFEVLMKDCSS